MTDHHVSAEGDDESGTGSRGSPFRTIARVTSGVKLAAGDQLILHGGIYLEPLELTGLDGSAAPITIRAAAGDLVAIESAARDSREHRIRFRDVPNDDWTPGDAPDEYVSALPFPPGTNHGALLDQPGIPHLITYSNIRDFRARNQRWGALRNGDPIPAGFNSSDFVEAFTGKGGHEKPLGFRRPWVYMGPGIFQEADGHIRIRLTATANNVSGFADYQEETDPRRTRLAIWSRGPTAIISRCVGVRLKDLVLRFGTRTVRVEESIDTRFDHIRIDAGEYGIQFGQRCRRSTMRHCIVDGGMPPWYYRSDRKDDYKFLAPGGAFTVNALGAGTIATLMYGASDCTDTLIENCEFSNGHDLFLFGRNLEFRKNWISNLNDDALVLDAQGVDNLRVHENVIERSLTALSFAQDRAAGNVAVYRNLIDLRRPTAGIRPQFDGTGDPLRYGHLFKDNSATGPIDLVHNTVVVTRQADVAATFNHFRSWDRLHRRRALNNIFVAVNLRPEDDRPMAYLPTPPAPGITDGNCYHRIGHHDNDLFRFERYTDPTAGTEVRGGGIHDMAALRVHPLANFGVEAHSIEADPLFRRFTQHSSGPSAVDLRLTATSPCRNAGIDLPNDLPPDPGPDPRPDIGCYPFAAGPLVVGLDGRRRFPSETAPFDPAANWRGR